MSGRHAHIGVAGGGAWGTALALTAHRAGRKVTLWVRRAELAAEINATHRNERYLPGHALASAIEATADPARLDACDVVLLATPAQASRSISLQLAPYIGAAAPVVVCAKGIESATGKLLPQAVAEALSGRPISILSGPSFAQEVASGLPTAITLASPDRLQGEQLARALSTPAFRSYWSDDVTGVALGGAIKNVLAIACGIVEGRQLGENARAAVLTRGFAEMARLGMALGAQLQTMSGLSGLGDLTLTCNGRMSRNRALGAALGRGDSASDALATTAGICEGFYTAPVLQALAQRLDVEMPICNAVTALLHEKADLNGTIGALLARPLKGEVT